MMFTQCMKSPFPSRELFIKYVLTYVLYVCSKTTLRVSHRYVIIETRTPVGAPGDYLYRYVKASSPTPPHRPQETPPDERLQSQTALFTSSTPAMENSGELPTVWGAHEMAVGTQDLIIGSRVAKNRVEEILN
jgi:hypothetical protein